MTDDPVQQRARHIHGMKKEIVIGFAAPRRQADLPLFRGVELAVREINASGGVIGRKIQLKNEDDEDSVAKAIDVASLFGADRNISAVIGHASSDISVPASVIYEYFGIVMVSPSSSAPVLTKRGLKHVFRIIPSDEETGNCMADFCMKQGYGKIMIYHVDNNYGTGLANSFQTSAARLGIQVLDRRRYPDGSRDTTTFISDLKYWKSIFSFDAIFLAGALPEAGLIIREARKLDLNMPIIGGDGFCDDLLATIIGDSTKDIFASSIFDAESATPVSTSFVEKFTKEYKQAPTDEAAEGHDAVMVLAEAIRTANSAVPAKIAEALHSIRNHPGVTGPNTFDEKGDVRGKPIIIMSFRNGHFRRVTDSQELH
jgi:branched-chain amino acid transport system substrate-binding protein